MASTVDDRSADPPPVARPEGAETDDSVLLRSVPWRFISYLFPQLYVVALSVAAARFLGPSRMGQQSYMAFVGLTVVALAQGGVPTAVVRFLSESLGSRRFGRARAVQRWALWGISVNALIGLAVVGTTAGFAHGYRAGWILVCASTVPAILNGYPLAILAALHRWRLTATVYLLNDTVTLGLTIAALALGFGITGMFAAEAVGGIAPLVIFMVTAGRGIAACPESRPGDVEPGLHRRLLRFATLGTMQTLVAYVVFRRTELLFLRHYSSNRQIAIYSIAFAASSALQQLPQTLQSVMLPTYSSYVGAGRVDLLRDTASRTLRLMAVLTLPLAAVGAALAPHAISVLYGARYAGAGYVLLILVPAVAIVPIAGVGTPVLGAMERQRWPLIYTVVACGVDAGMAAALVPTLGARGAAIAGVCAQLAATLPLAVYAGRLLGGFDLYPRHLLAAVFSSVAGAAAALAGTAAVPGVAGLVLGLVLGLAGFLAAGRVTRVLSPSDAEWLEASGRFSAAGAAGRLTGRTVRWLAGGVA